MGFAHRGASAHARENTLKAFRLAVDMGASGLAIRGQVRDMAFLERADGELLIVVARNGENPQILRHRP